MFSAPPVSTRIGSAPLLTLSLTLSLFMTLALAGGAALAVDNPVSSNDAPVAADAGDSADAVAVADTLQYTVRIQAPQPLAQLLEKNLDLMRFRGNARIDRRQLQRLIRAAPQQIEELVATEGYYTPEIKVQLDASSAEPVVVIEVTPGEPVQVGSIDLVLQGFGASAGDAPFDTTAIKASWGLPQGQIFRQADWETAKRNLLRQVLQTRYAHAQLSVSQASVDPQTHRAALRVVLDSGPELRFGELRIEGLQRYPASVVSDLNQIKPGDYYSEEKLQAYQSRLQESTYFSSIEVSADLPVRVEPAAAATDTAAVPPLAPLLVRVTENKRHQANMTSCFESSTTSVVHTS